MLKRLWSRFALSLKLVHEKAHHEEPSPSRPFTEPPHPQEDQDAGTQPAAPSARTDILSPGNVGTGRAMLKRLWSRFAGRLLRSREPELSEDDLDHMRSWSISAQLAAVPPNYEHQVPARWLR